MKNKPFQVCSKLCLKTFILCIWIFTLGLSASNSSAQSINEVNISLNLKDATVENILQSIEQKTSFTFAYQQNLIAGISKRITIKTNKETVASILNRISNNTTLSFKQINGNTIAVNQIKKRSVVRNSNTKTVIQSTIQGVITDETGMSLPGANIIEKGTSNGVTTDFDGKYSITVSNSNAVLIFSYVGYQSQEIIVGNQATINVQIKQDASQLDEVVVIGYGTRQLTKVSGSIAKAPIGELQDFPVSNFDQALAGKLTGVQVLQTTGEPGRELTIKVRGTGTITAGAEPLYVVDGVPIESSGQATEIVNLEDIESIQILKDASSASIYGSRGGNGVVLISTKKGKQGKMRVNFSHSTGFQELSKKIDMMDAYEYAQLSKDGHDAAYLQEVPTGSADDPNSIRPVGYHKVPEELLPYIAGVEGLTNTDWQDAIYRSAIIQKYNLSISGGTEKLNYFVSANHSNQDGIIINSDYNKTGLRANLGLESGKFKIGLNLSPSYTIENRVSANNPWWNDGIVQAALAYSPTWSVYNPDGSFNYQGNGFWRIGTDYQHNEIVNPVALVTVPKNEIEHYNLLSNLFVEYEVLEDLKLKSSFAVNYNQYQNEFYRPADLETRGRNNTGRLSNPSARLSTTNIYNWLWENTINYKKTFGNHNLDL